MYRDTLVQAIRERRIVEFAYGGYRRVAEPHTLGMARGALQLLAYQIGGRSRSGTLPPWRRFQLEKVSELVVTDKRFPGYRPGASGHHVQWDYKIEFVPPE